MAGLQGFRPWEYYLVDGLAGWPPIQWKPLDISQAPKLHLGMQLLMESLYNEDGIFTPISDILNINRFLYKSVFLSNHKPK